MGQAPGALAARRGLLSPSQGGVEGGLTQAAAEGEKDQVGPRAGWPDQHCTGSSTDPLSPPVKLAVSPSRAPVAVSSLARRPRSAMETPVLCNEPLGCTVKRSRAFSSPLPTTSSACLRSVENLSQSSLIREMRNTEAKGNSQRRPKNNNVVSGQSRTAGSFSRTTDNTLSHVLRDVLQILRPQAEEVNCTMARLYPRQKLPRFRELASKKWEQMDPGTED